MVSDAHFVLKKSVEVPEEPETVIAIDRGEHNLAVAIAISKKNPDTAIRGRFWRGEEIKRIRGLYSHIRRKLQEKKLLKKVKKLKEKEKRKVNQQLHIIANQIIAYAKQFPKPIIVMENLNGIRNNFKKSKKLNRRFHSLPFRKLQTIIEYKALLEGIEVKYLTKKETKNTSKKCHRCGACCQVKGRIYKCLNCGMEYDRDLNTCINIAHRVTSSMGWRSREPLKPADEAESVKLQRTLETPNFSRGVTHNWVISYNSAEQPMDRIRVCVVTHLFLPHVGGIERVVYEQSKRLPLEKYEPIILTSNIYGKNSYTVDGLSVYCYPTLKVGFKLGIPYSIPKPSGFRLFLDQVKRCDIVHAHGHPYLSSYLAIKIAKKFSKPVILTQHNTFIEYGNFWDNVECINDAIIGRSNLRAADRIIVVSKATMNYVLSLGADPQRTEILYNGVDLERFKPVPSMKTEFRSLLGIPENYFVALTVRRLVYKNGIDFLLESARIAVKKNPRLLFLVIGGGPDFEKIRDKISEFKLEGNFKLLGFVPDDMLPQYYNASDVFVLPSKSGEGLPLVLLEAMACGLPVIATNVGGVPEIVNESCGEIVQPGDALSLAESLVKFSHGDTNFHRVKVRKFAEQKFDWNENVKKLAKIYEELI